MMEVHAADVQDRDGVEGVLSAEVRAKYPLIAVVWVDGGYQGRAETRMAQRGWRLKIVRRRDQGVWRQKGEDAPEPPRGFQVVKWRWIVERTFAWLSQFRRLTRDYEKTPQAALAWMHIAIHTLLLRRLTAA